MTRHPNKSNVNNVYRPICHTWNTCRISTYQ